MDPTGAGVVAIITAVVAAVVSIYGVLTTQRKESAAARRQEHADAIEHYNRIVDRLTDELRQADTHVQTLTEEHTRCREDVARLTERVTKIEEEGLQTRAQVIADTSGIITAISPMVCLLFGYAWPHDLIGKKINLLIPDRLRERHERSMGRAVEMGIAQYVTRTIHTMGRRRDGTEIPIMISLKAIRQDSDWVFSAEIMQRPEVIP